MNGRSWATFMSGAHIIWKKIIWLKNRDALNVLPQNEWKKTIIIWGKTLPNWTLWLEVKQKDSFEFIYVVAQMAQNVHRQMFLRGYVDSENDSIIYCQTQQSILYNSRRGQIYKADEKTKIESMIILKSSLKLLQILNWYNFQTIYDTITQLLIDTNDTRLWFVSKAWPWVECRMHD